MTSWNYVPDGGHEMPGRIQHFWKQVTITEDQALSEWIQMEGLILTGIDFPAEWDGATVSFQIQSFPNGTAYDLYDGSNEFHYEVAASRSLLIRSKEALLLGPKFRIRAGLTAAPTNQTTTDTVLTLRAIKP